MFGNLFKKLVPIAIAGAGLYTGASMFTSMGGSSLFASSTLTDTWKKKLAQASIEKGLKSMLGTPSESPDPSDYDVDFDEYQMALAQSSGSGGKGSRSSFGQLKSADPEAIAYAWQRRLNSYLKSGDIV